MVQQHSTINPAGNPIVRKPAGEKPYTRDDFVADLQKVSKKSSKK